MTAFADDRTTRRSALIVSADVATRTRYSSVLAPMLDEFDFAEDGRDALAKTIATVPSVVVTDEQLPFFNGDTLCALLRSDPLTADVRLVVISSEAESMTGRARRCGIDRVLAAPVDATLLSQTIRDALCAEEPIAPAKSMVGPAPRSERSSTPRVPPQLRCPACDRELEYTVSYIGGPLASREQWDGFVCRACNQDYEYRHRTRMLRAVTVIRSGRSGAPR